MNPLSKVTIYTIKRENTRTRLISIESHDDVVVIVVVVSVVVVIIVVVVDPRNLVLKLG